MASNPQPGDFGLVDISGSVGLLVQVGQWLVGDGFTSPTHAFVFMGNGWVLEAQPGGARYTKLTKYADREITWSKWPLSGDQRKKVRAFARQRRGTPYSFVDYLSLALARVGLRPVWLQQYIATNKHMICSQLVDAAYRAADVHLFTDGRLSGDVTPGDLYRVLDPLGTRVAP